MVSLDRFELFCAVVEAGSFTAAATRLGQTRAAVSFGIKQLESQLGVTLLTRTTRRVALTDAGEGFYRCCVQVLEQALVPERSALLVPVPLLGRSVLEPALVPVPVLVLELQLARAPLALVPQLA